MEQMLTDHADAGSALRLAIVALTFVLVVALFTKPNVLQIVLRVLAVILALTSVFFVIRTGHLGAKLAWGREGQGGPPTGFQGGPPPGGGQGPPPEGG